MKLFRGIITNLLGNILALINLVVIAIGFSITLLNHDFFKFIFSIFLIWNIPSNAFASLITNILFMFPTNSEVTESIINFHKLTFLISIYFQWAIIGYIIGKFRGK